MTEIWRSIKDYSGYEVSNLGRVRSFKFNKVRIKGLITNKLKKEQSCLWFCMEIWL